LTIESHIIKRHSSTCCSKTCHEYAFEVVQNEVIGIRESMLMLVFI